MQSMSGHADRDELLAWIEGLQQKPKRVFVTHGEPEAADSLRRLIEDRFRITAIVPEYEEEFELN